MPRNASRGKPGKCPDKTSTKPSIGRLLDRPKPLRIRASQSSSVIFNGTLEGLLAFSDNSAHSGSEENKAALPRNGSPKLNLSIPAIDKKGSLFRGAASARAEDSADPEASFDAGDPAALGT